MSSPAISAQKYQFSGNKVTTFLIIKTSFEGEYHPLNEKYRAMNDITVYEKSMAFQKEKAGKQINIFLRVTKGNIR